MTRIEWGAPGTKTYEQGLDRGVLYPRTGPGVPWTGLVSVSEETSGGEVESFYYDGVKYLDVILYEDYQATLEAFDAPFEFGVCDGNRPIALGLFATQQPREPFGLSFRTQVGNDLTEEAGYKINLVYNCMASPAERTRKTTAADVELEPIAWTLYTRPPRRAVYGGATYKPTAHLIIDSRSGNPHLETLELALYGANLDHGPWNPRLPTQQEIVNLLNTGFWT